MRRIALKAAMAAATAVTAVVAAPASSAWSACVERTTVYVLGRPVTIERYCVPPELAPPPAGR